MENKGQQCRLVTVPRLRPLREILRTSNSISGGTLCVFGNHTFVPINWCARNTHVCDGVHLFVNSATCLGCCGETCETVIVPFHSTRMNLFAQSLFYPFYDRLAQGQSVSLHIVWFHSCALWRKRKFIETVLVITILLTCWQYRSRRERINYIFVGSCPVSTVFSSRTVYTERTI